MPKTRDSKGRFTSNQSNRGNGKPRVTANDLVSMLLNASYSRSYWGRQGSAQLDGPRRSVDDECSYPITQNITVENLREMYEREPVAARVVELWPKECWRSNPAVYEDNDPNKVTEFEEAWDELGGKLQANWGLKEGKPERKSWFKSEEGSPIWDYLCRADILSGIGSYGGILLGLDDGQELDKAVKIKPGRELLFMRCLSQDLMPVSTWEQDQAHPRYGMPTSYSVSLNDPIELEGTNLSQGTFQVHWSRIIHLADNRGSSEVFGTPRQRAVWNRLLDLRKIHGGDAEAFWQQVVQKHFLEVDPGLIGDIGGTIDIDEDDMRDAFEKMMTGLQQWMIIKGAKVNTVSPQVVDPSNHIDAAVTSICVKLGVPKRIFTGSERGELASSQDDRSWNRRVLGRQTGYLTPKVIVPFVDRLIMIGVLPEPEEYNVTWSREEHLTSMEQAELAYKLTQSLTEYISKGGEMLVTPMDWLTGFMGRADEDAETMLKNTNAVDKEDHITREEPPEPPEPPQPEEGEEPAREPALARSVAPEGSSEPEPEGTKPPDQEPTENYSPNQPRDSQGRFGSGGGGAMAPDTGGMIQGGSGKGGEGAGLYPQSKMKYPEVPERQKETIELDELVNKPEHFDQIDIPDKMYHITDRSNLESIQKHGLKVGQPRASEDGVILGTYLVKSPDDFSDPSFGDLNIKDPVILEVSTRGMGLRLDPEYAANAAGGHMDEFISDVNSGVEMGAMYSPEGIPKGNIKVWKDKTKNIDRTENPRGATKFARTNAKHKFGSILPEEPPSKGPSEPGKDAAKGEDKDAAEADTEE